MGNEGGIFTVEVNCMKETRISVVWVGQCPNWSTWSHWVWMRSDIKFTLPGTSLVAQWLRLLASNAGGRGLIPGWGAKIPQALQSNNQNIKQKQYCNTCNKDFKNGPNLKKKKS